MKSIRRLSTALMFSAVVFSTYANEKPCDTLTKTKETNKYCFISPGIAKINLNDINNSLATFRISPFTEEAWTISIGEHTERGRMISEGMTTLRIWGSNLDAGYRTSLFMGNTGCFSGFNTLPTNFPVNLYPYIGLNAGVNILHIRSNEKALSDLLVSSSPNSYLWQVTGLLNLGLGSECKIFSKDKKSGATIGLRMGYFVDLFKDKKWTSDGVKVTGLSSISQNGPYIHLVLGGWDKKKHLSCRDSL